MSKKSLYELQYENAKIENDVNKGCAIVGLVFIAFTTLFLLGCVILFIR